MWFDRFHSAPAIAKVAEPSPAPPPRATRFQLDALVSFAGEEGTQEGRCINVSESGLLARFDTPPELWTNGRLNLEAGEHFLSIQARVARIQGKEAGFAFLFSNDSDRAAIAILLASVLDHPLSEPVSADGLQART
jgi:hypothetical protein